jgi:AcrR family transcriptional regulator
VYGGLSRESSMSDQLSAADWVEQGIKALIRNGFTALKAEPLAQAMGVSRGSFYWHFKDIKAFHVAILARWREVAAEQIIANVEAASRHESPLPVLLRRTFGSKPVLEVAVRSWALHDPVARTALHALDRRRLNYVADLFERSGLSPEIAGARAQIFYWAFLGFALSDKPLPKARQDMVLEELIRLALR